MRQNVLSALVLAVCGVVAGALMWSRFPAAGAALIGAGLGAGGLMMLATLRRQPHVPWAQARALVGHGRAVVFWKPTCRYCTRLRRELGEDPRVVWVNVWVDREANHEVRALNGGNEYTPTAVVESQVLRNPSADAVRAALAG